MKRTSVIILVIVFVLSLSACGENIVDNIEEDNIFGPWEAVGCEIDGRICDVYLDFEESGRGSYTTIEEDTENHTHDYFTYVINGNALTITCDSLEVTECEFEVKDDILLIATEDNTIEFKRNL